MAGELGFEPRMAGSEPDVLPLHHSPKAYVLSTKVIIANPTASVKHFFEKNEKIMYADGTPNIPPAYAAYSVYFALTMHSISMLSPIGSADTSTQVRAGKFGAKASA